MRKNKWKLGYPRQDPIWPNNAFCSGPPHMLLLFESATFNSFYGMSCFYDNPSGGDVIEDDYEDTNRRLR